MEKFNSPNYRQPRQKSILLLWAECPNAKLIMSDKAPALRNASVCKQVCVLTWARVCQRVKSSGGCKTFTVTWARCMRPQGERVFFYFCAGGYEQQRRKWDASVSKACCSQPLIHLQNGANKAECRRAQGPFFSKTSVGGPKQQNLTLRTPKFCLILIIAFMVIDLPVFRPMLLTLITHLTVGI